MITVLRYPRIVTLLRHQCSLTITEAIGLLEGRCGEAVNHYGGPEKCLKDSIHHHLNIGSLEEIDNY